MAKARRVTEFPVSLYGTPSPLHQEVFYTVLRAGYLRAGPGYGVQRDLFSGFELILCLRGESAVRVGGTWHEVWAGDLVVFNCHHPHEHRAAEGDPWDAYWIRVDGPKLDRMCSILGVERDPVIRGVERGEATAAFERVFALMREGTGESAPRVHAEVARLWALACCARQLPAEDDPEALRPAVEHMRQYYFEEHRLEALAARAGLSASHFSRLFRRAFGTSPIDWLRRERINQAKRRLGETADPVEWIAEQVGYRDRFFFSKDFKRMTGLTPREFRRQESGRAER